MRILLLMATASLTFTLGGCEKLPDDSASASKAGAPPPLVRGTPINNPAADPVAETRGAEPAATGKPVGSASLPVPQKPKGAASPVGRPDPDHPGYLLVQFEDLAGYDYNDLHAAATSQPDGRQGAGGLVGPPAAPQTNAQIPARIMALNGKPVTLQGFMVPLEFKRDSVRSFLLVRNQLMCCFGATMGMNEWVLVEMKSGRNVTLVQDVPTVVWGEFEVGEEFEGSTVTSIYRLKGEDVSVKGGR